MKTKIYIDGRYNSEFLCDGKRYTKFQLYTFLAKRMAKKCMLIALVTVLGGWLFTAGVLMARSTIQPERVYAKETIEVPVIQFEDIPLLVKICKAESGNRQFNSKGDVLRGRANPSDIGFCQINEYINNDYARKLGYDIYTEEGNKAFAVVLFLERGAQPWSASKKSSENPNGWTY